MGVGFIAEQFGAGIAQPDDLQHQRAVVKLVLPRPAVESAP